MKWHGVLANNAFKALLTVVFKLCYRMKVVGAKQCPRTGGLIVVANHVSLLDPPLLGCALPRPLVYTPRATLRNSRLYRFLTGLLDLEHVERDGRDLAATRRLIERLKRGDAVALFPEQTRSPDGQLQRLTPGFAMLAAQAQVPVLPVVIEGAFEAWPRGRSRPLASGRIELRVGPPLDLGAMDRRQAVACLEQAFRTLGARMRASEVSPPATVAEPAGDP
ncbi:MAG: 1-acyl-sn-glycerol-3-phosphate acyltransferase [Planctomycetes bacterium]|nr:1-acyl-sn-glycerol-3-phosphate acyltransferase [Planctomycetota bacterium]